MAGHGSMTLGYAELYYLVRMRLAAGAFWACPAMPFRGGSNRCTLRAEPHLMGTVFEQVRLFINARMDIFIADVTCSLLFGSKSREHGSLSLAL